MAWIRCIGDSGGGEGSGGNAQSLELNLIPNTFIDNGGAEVSYSSWTSTDFIDISTYNTIYTISFYDQFNAFYDENKTYISMFCTNSQIIEIPAGAVYMRLSDPSTTMSTAKIFVEVPGGGSSNKLLVADWDFTDSLTDKVQGLTATLTGATRDSNGVNFTASSHKLELPPFLYGRCMTYEIEFGTMDGKFGSGQHGNVISFLTDNNSNGGFAWRYQTQKFAIWENGNGWQESDIVDMNYFSNSTLKLRIDSEGYWHIYKDDVIVFEPPLVIGAYNLTTSEFNIGLINNNSFYDMNVKSFKAYYEFD